MHIRLVLLSVAVLFLAGCSVMDPAPKRPDLIHEIMPPLSVVLDARGGGGLSFDWDFGDGATAMDAEPIVSHSYASPGVYPVIVYWRGRGGAGGDGPAIGGSTAPGGNTQSAYVVVDVTEEGRPAAAILALRNGQPSGAFWAWDQPVFYAGHSGGEELWYQWKAERRYRKDGQWVGWHVPEGYAERHYYQGESWVPHNLFLVPGSEYVSPTPSEIQYRITLIVTDTYGRQDTVQVGLTIYTGC